MLAQSPIAGAPIGAQYASATTTVPAATVTGVAITPASVALVGGASQQFTATAAGTNNPPQTFTWSKVGGGTLDAAGNFVAPAATSSSQTITITAASTLDANQKGTATVTVAAVVISQPVPTTTRSITLNLFTPTGAGAASLTNLRWAWFDQPTPDLFTSTTDKGNAEVTDASGVLTIPLPNSALADGGIGWLVITDSNGNPATTHNAFSGPVAITAATS